MGPGTIFRSFTGDTYIGVRNHLTLATAKHTATTNIASQRTSLRLSLFESMSTDMSPSSGRPCWNDALIAIKPSVSASFRNLGHLAGC